MKLRQRHTRVFHVMSQGRSLAIGPQCKTFPGVSTKFLVRPTGKVGVFFNSIKSFKQERKRLRFYKTSLTFYIIFDLSFTV